MKSTQSGDVLVEKKPIPAQRIPLTGDMLCVHGINGDIWRPMVEAPGVGFQPKTIKYRYDAM